MAFNEVDLKRIEKAASDFLAARRPPPHIRAQLDLEYVIHNQTVELLEVRPRWNNPSEIAKRSFAKATFVRSANQWRIYWMRGNLKWHPYDPASTATVAQFFKIVDEDRYGCFFG
jgi:hypothetical protein